jgi:hypothetical protein
MASGVASVRRVEAASWWGADIARGASARTSREADTRRNAGGRRRKVFGIYSEEAMGASAGRAKGDATATGWQERKRPRRSPWAMGRVIGRLRKKIEAHEAITGARWRSKETRRVITGARGTPIEAGRTSMRAVGTS